MRFAFIGAWRYQWRVSILCRMMRVSERGYRFWRARPICQRRRTDVAVLAHIPKDHIVSGQPFEWLGPLSNIIRFITCLQFVDFPAEPPNNPKPPAPDDVFNTMQIYIDDMIKAFESV
jgi:hypothetical protein